MKRELNGNGTVHDYALYGSGTRASVRTRLLPQAKSNKQLQLVGSTKYSYWLSKHSIDGAISV